MPTDAPFPVGERYNVAPDLKRLEGEGHFLVDDAYERYLEEKLDLLEARPELCRCLDPAHEEEGLREALWHVFDVLATEHPEIVEMSGNRLYLKRLGLELHEDGLSRIDPAAPLARLGERAAGWLKVQEGLTRLADALALSIQEDYVILRGSAERHGAELLHVLFPSHWNPVERAGSDFTELHRPVAHNHTLLASSERVMRALFHKGPFIRYVWGIETDPRLGHNPAMSRRRSLPEEVLADPDKLIGNLHFRTERQTTLAMPGLGRCLFTIRVTVRPLSEVLIGHQRGQRLALALQSMDEALLAYKGLTRLRAPLLAWLEQRLS